VKHFDAEATTYLPDHWSIGLETVMMLGLALLS
jgi:hypothetical protein